MTATAIELFEAKHFPEVALDRIAKVNCISVGLDAEHHIVSECRGLDALDALPAAHLGGQAEPLGDALAAANVDVVTGGELLGLT